MAARRGGRSGPRSRCAALPALQRKMPLYEVLTPEWIDRVHDTAMHLLEDRRHRLPRGRGAGEMARRRCHGRRPARPHPARPAHGPGRQGARALHPARAQPGQVGRDRRQHDGVRPDLRLALRARLRRRAPLRHDRGPQQLPQAGLHGPGAAEHGLGRLRAGRRRHPQAPPAHHGLRDPPQRQELHGPGHPARPRRRRRAHVRDRLRQRVRPRQCGHGRPGQRQLAPGLGRHHDRRPARLRPRRPGPGRGPVHAGRRQHPGLGHRHRRRADGRGALRHRLRPARAARAPR